MKKTILSGKVSTEEILVELARRGFYGRLLNDNNQSFLLSELEGEEGIQVLQQVCLMG